MVTLLPFRLAFAGAVSSLAPVTEADGKLGLCDVLPGPTPGTSGAPWAQLAYNAGARFNRWEIRWDQVEVLPGVWSFSEPDAAVTSSEKYGLKVLGILIGTPDWAAAARQSPGNGVPAGLYRGVADPQNVWAGYVRETVTRYRNRIHYWEIWNEPDLHFFWNGSADDYYQLLKVAYLVIHTIDPGAKVLLAGMVVPDLAFLSRILDDGRRDAAGGANHGFFDIAAWHAYGPARSLYDDALHIKQVLGAHDYGGVPLWVTEDGFPASNPKGASRQAAYVIETIAYGLAAGVNRILVYRTSDDPSTKTWGLLTADGAPRPAYVAFQEAARYFAHWLSISYSTSGQVERFVFYKRGQRVTLLWNRSLTARPALLPADNRSALIVDSVGNSLTRQAVRGGIKVIVPAAFYNVGVDASGAIVGGPSLLVAQENPDSTSLPLTAFVSPMLSRDRRLVLVNPEGNTAQVRISTVGDMTKNFVVSVMPNSIRSIDLELLSGTAYAGSYGISSSNGIAVEGVSKVQTTPAVQANKAWYVPSLARSLSLANVSTRNAAAVIKVFGERGVLRQTKHVYLNPRSAYVYSLSPELVGKRVSLEVTSSQPIVVSNEKAEPSLSKFWYALKPRNKKLTVFNPDRKTSARVIVTLIGLHGLKRRRLNLQPHHSSPVPSHGARAITVVASSSVAVAYRDTAPAAGGLAAGASRKSTTIAAGTATRVQVFNPSDHPAHVQLSIVDGHAARRIKRTIAPAGLVVVSVRRNPGTPAGATISSDVPVAVAATQ